MLRILTVADIMTYFENKNGQYKKVNGKIVFSVIYF